MQKVSGSGQPLVVVDYAHTPDALEKVLATLRPIADSRSGRLVVVFGCGGDRDPGKRVQMGAIASRMADKVVLTSDNPRSEAPDAIIDQIAAGTLDSPSSIDRIARRDEAILTAVSAASERDTVLIAGKGHETYQEIAGVRHPFSDTDHARTALAGWRSR